MSTFQWRFQTIVAWYQASSAAAIAVTTLTVAIPPARGFSGVKDTPRMQYEQEEAERLRGLASIMQQGRSSCPTPLSSDAESDAATAAARAAELAVAELLEHLQAYFGELEKKRKEAHGKVARTSSEELTKLARLFVDQQDALNIQLLTLYKLDLRGLKTPQGQLLYSHLMAFYKENDPSWERTALDDVVALATSHSQSEGRRHSLNKKLQKLYGVGPSPTRCAEPGSLARERTV